MTRSSGESLFISDLHLAPERPATIELLLRFLGERARQAERLFILGDLFETWIGDDDDAPAYIEVRAALRRLVEAGTHCALMHGNRDFLIGRTFCRETHCQLLKDPTALELGGERVLLMHGDLLCSDDIPYQRFRRRIRNPLVIWLFRRKSLASRRALAANYRRKSGAATSAKAEHIMDVNQNTVVRYLRRYAANRLVHGHTHRPGDHSIDLGGELLHRHVLAQWHEATAEALAYRDGRWYREALV
ncbi:UDP-2,3-diacylglucosamine diphosphatase [Thiorhodococcus mannitoliphagus]|uniref:UDP-2,3-diacylglucosamine hydrolase n=1 Tax=Thiorhodococcus mannitoliphagus TaxID=329406 RepID=A0A6P1DQ69_9GAMM|nr:UDP-2,3-diacylglucosamine diphosphatase [Thiorhodococcus mannitoliphagus]NEX19700.1 UDP-2,3-diacylglucosamine diphosphatase [Thiorhodococcus mannitoliphagus]